MKFKVIQGEKGKKQNQENQMPEGSKVMDDYYAKERPRSQDIEQAEGDEEIVDEALKNQKKTGDAA